MCPVSLANRIKNLKSSIMSDAVLNPCDVKYIANSIIDEIDREELMGSIQTNEINISKDNVDVTPSEQEDKIKYHALKIAEDLGIEVDDKINQQIRKIPILLPKENRFGLVEHRSVAQTCTIKMKQEHYDYIFNDSPEHNSFVPQIEKDKLPSGSVKIDIIDKQERIEITNETEPIRNPAPDWWDSRNFTESLIRSHYVQKLNNYVLKINEKACFQDYSDGARVLLSDACFVFKSLSMHQILLTYIVLQGKSCLSASEILNKIDPEEFPLITKASARTCVNRTLRGNMFNARKVFRNTGYLSYIDSMILIAEIDMKIAAGNAPKTDFVIERAKELYEARITKFNAMRKFIRNTKEIDDPFISDDIFDTKWVYNFARRAGFIRTQGDALERDRGINCTAAALIRWSLQFGNILESYKNKGEMLFNFDESMIECCKESSKFITRKGSEKPVKRDEADTEHITIGCCFNAVGISPPLFIILNRLQKFPKELDKFVSPNVHFVTQCNGWIDRKLFYSWATMFCDWINKYREEKRRADETVTLLLDSHNSRANSEALELFKACNVRVITFPPHCTHALQPFDVCIAKKLKETYTKLYTAAVAGNEECKMHTALRREIAIDCIITAWNMVMNYKAAAEAFRKTGMHPFDTGTMLMARGVNTISDKDPEKEERRKENRLFISSSELTNEEMINRIKQNEEAILKKKKPVETTSKSLTFKELDPIQVINKHDEMCKNTKLKSGVACLKGSEIKKISENKNAEPQLPPPKQIPPNRFDDSAIHELSENRTIENRAISAKQQISKMEKKQKITKKSKISPRIAKLQFPRPTILQKNSESQPLFADEIGQSPIPSPAPSPAKFSPLKLKI